MANNLLRQPSRGAHYSIIYITAGTLIVIWSAIWWYYMNRNGVPSGDWKYYICVGLLLSGTAVILIGILVGRIGREAQNADVPVGQVTAASVAPLSNVPAPPPATNTVVPTTPPVGAGQPAVTPAGQPVVPASQPVVQPAAPPATHR